MDENIRKYEEIGTHPAANHNAIAVALAFHRGIGVERKAARLRYLRNRWAKRLLAPQKTGRLRRKPPGAAWRLEGAAQFYSGQTKHVRPAVVLRTHDRPAPSFPPVHKAYSSSINRPILAKCCGPRSNGAAR